MRYNFEPITMAEIKITGNRRYWEDIEKWEHSYLPDGNINYTAISEIV